MTGGTSELVKIDLDSSFFHRDAAAHQLYQVAVGKLIDQRFKQPGRDHVESRPVVVQHRHRLFTRAAQHLGRVALELSMLIE